MSFRDISQKAMRKLESQLRRNTQELLDANDQLKQEVAERERAELTTRTLFRISSAVNTTKDLSDLYSSIHQILGEIMNLSNFFIAIYHKDESKVLFPYFVDTNDPVLKSYDPFRTDNSLTGEVIITGKPVFHTEEMLAERAQANRIIGTAPLVWLGVPLKIKGEVIGVMATQCYENPNQFSRLDLDILNSVSDQVALVIERKRNEQALIASERRYRNIIEDIEEGYFEIDCDGRLKLVNRAMCQMLGYSEAELLAIDGSGGPSDADRKKLTGIFRELQNVNLLGQVRELEIERSTGENRFIETVVTGIRDNTSELIGFRGIARDITNRKIQEAARKELEEQLQQSQRLESLGTLAGGIAHDFNNLLMGIQGRTSLMLTDLPTEHPHYEHLASIKEYLESAAELTGRLLGFARGGKYEVGPVNLNEMAEKCTAMYGRTRKEITIKRALAENLDVVEADANQLEQVLVNLLVNAGQAMPDGGDLEVSTGNLVIDAGKAQNLKLTPGAYVRIQLTDSGHGMDSQTMARIFDPFFTTKPVGRGTGLGLAMVYGIIRNHAGKILVESEPGQGTTFTLLLPASARQIVEKVKPVHELLYGTGTVLLVDDEQIIIDVGRKILESLGYTVLIAKSGQEAITTYQDNRGSIAAVIMDMIMPNMNGSELFERLKGIDPAVRVLLCSGYSMEGQAREIMNKGCQGFIQKPFSVAQLSMKLREAIGGTVVN